MTYKIRIPKKAITAGVKAMLSMSEEFDTAEDIVKEIFTAMSSSIRDSQVVTKSRAQSRRSPV